jgi:hypothetical protein
MEKEMAKSMKDMDEHFLDSFTKDKMTPEAKPIEAKAKSNLTNIESNKDGKDAMLKPDRKVEGAKSVTAEREYTSSEFANAETTTECNKETGVCNVDKCVNGACKKFT